MKKCPYCAEQIQDEALKCRFCGEMLDRQESQRQKEGVAVLRRFQSTALKDGKKCRGVFEAHDREEAKKKLIDQGYEIVTLREVWSHAPLKAKLRTYPKAIKYGVVLCIVALLAALIAAAATKKTGEPKKKPELSKRLYTLSTTIKDYTIVDEKITNYKQIQGDLSRYSADQISTAPFVLKKELKVVAPNLSKEDTDIIIKDIINKQLQKDSDIDELVISLYATKEETAGDFSVAKAIWAVKGALGAITPHVEKTNDKSTHEINIAYNEAAFRVASAATSVAPLNYQSDDRLNPVQVDIVKHYLSALREHPELTEQIISLKISEAYGLMVADLKAMHREYMDGDYE